MIAEIAESGRVIIFVSTRDGCDGLVGALRRGAPPSRVKVEGLHGDMDQARRVDSVNKFKKGEANVLVGTDLAGRGLDIPDVATVVNFDTAKDLDMHSHRVGRAGRMGAAGYAQGSAYTLLGRGDGRFGEILANAWRREGREVDRVFRAFVDDYQMNKKKGGGKGDRRQHQQHQQHQHQKGGGGTKRRFDYYG